MRTPLPRWVTLYGTAIPASQIESIKNMLAAASIETVTIDGGHIDARGAIRKVTRNMEMGAHFLLHAHGTILPRNDISVRGRHRVSLPNRSDKTIATRVLLRRILEPLVTRRRARGDTGRPFVFITCCGAGALRDSLRPGSKLWQSAYFVTLTGRRATNFNKTGPALEAVIKYIGRCESRHEKPNPYQVMAIVGGLRGDCVTLMGGELQAPLVWHAPQTTADLSGFIPTHRLSGTLDDRTTLLIENTDLAPEDAAMLTPSVYRLILNRIARDDMDALESLIAGLGESNQIIAHGFSIDDLAGYACEVSASRCLGLLLRAGCNPNARGASGDTLIAAYAQLAKPYNPTTEGWRWLVGLRLLLEAGADPNQQAQDGLTPLMRTVLAGNMPATKMLLAHGARTDTQWQGQDCLTIAANNHQIDVIGLLVEHGAASGKGELEALINQCIGDGNQRAVVALLTAQLGRMSAANSSGIGHKKTGNNV